jgi:hypothetical protein
MMSPVAILLLAMCASPIYAQWYGAWPYGAALPAGVVNTIPAWNGLRSSAVVPTGYTVPYSFNPYVYAPAPVVKSQYHSQTELGEASHGYSYPGQASSTFQDAWGNQIGSYAYINPEGKEVKVSYVADSLGFRVLSNDLPVAPIADLVAPVPVEDTVEVAEAKIAHLAAIEAAKSGVVAPLPIVPEMELPKPVEDTPEVAAAKADHAAAVIAAKALADASPEETKAETKEESSERRKRQIGLPLPLLRSPLAYSVVAPVAVAPAVATRDATLTQIVHNPGHAMSYRVD